MRRVADSSTTARPGALEQQLEQHRGELTGYAYRMLGSPFEAEDAVQETFLRAWRAHDRFEGRAALRSWLYRIATNVCLDMLGGRERRARPMDLGPAREPVLENASILPEVTWIEPIPDPADVAVDRETIRLAFVAALQHLPPRQRAVLILCEVLRWKASEVAELLETSVASVNSALQRARATLDSADVQAVDRVELDEPDRELLARYVQAFEAYDIDALTSLVHEDATQSMPPYDLWLTGRDDIFTWWFGPGIGCKGSRVIPTTSANGSPAFGQYKPSETGAGYDAWALQVIEISGGKVVEMTFFLGTETLFPLFGLPPRLDADGQPAASRRDRGDHVDPGARLERGVEPRAPGRRTRGCAAGSPARPRPADRACPAMRVELRDRLVHRGGVELDPARQPREERRQRRRQEDLRHLLHHRHLDRRDRRQVARDLAPGLALVDAREHLAGARAEVEARRVERVVRHPLAQDAEVRVLLWQALVEPLPGRARVAGAPDRRLAVVHRPRVPRVDGDDVERVLVVRMDRGGEAEVARQTLRDLRPRLPAVVAPVHAAWFCWYIRLRSVGAITTLWTQKPMSSYSRGQSARSPLFRGVQVAPSSVVSKRL